MTKSDSSWVIWAIGFFFLWIIPFALQLVENYAFCNGIEKELGVTPENYSKLNSAFIYTSNLNDNRFVILPRDYEMGCVPGKRNVMVWVTRFVISPFYYFKIAAYMISQLMTASF
jgi:hypothetical protein